MLRKNTWARWLTRGSKALIFGLLLVTVFSPLGGVFSTPTAQAAGECAPNNAGLYLVAPPNQDLVDGKCPPGFHDPTRKYPTAEGDVNEGIINRDNPLGRFLADIIYVFTVGLGTAVAYVGAWVFSLATVITLSSSAYALTFLSEGWEIVRDVANMFFILILVYIAFTVMFRADTAETMKRLAWVIAIALLINFSFFFVRVVIDAGNLLAVQFYNAIPAEPLQGTADGEPIVAGIAAATSNYFTSSGATKDLTSTIMNGIGAQNILNTKSFGEFATANNWLTELIALTFIYVALGAVLFILAAAFFTVGIKFIVRTAVLWLLLVASPLALIASTVRQGDELYKKWQTALIAHAFYPAVFLFIFYILTLFMEQLGQGGDVVATVFSGINATNAEGFGYIVALVAIIAIKLGFVIALLYLGLQAADRLGVAGAQLANTIASKVPFMGGLPQYAGGVYRNTIGRAAWRADRSLQTGLLGRGLSRVPGGYFLGDKLRRATVGQLRDTSIGGTESRTQVVDRARAQSRERDMNTRDFETRDAVARAAEAARNNQRPSPEDERRIRSLSRREMGMLGSRQLSGVAHMLTPTQLSALENLEGMSDTGRESIVNGWHRRGTLSNSVNGQFGSSEAPINRADRLIEEVQRLQTAIGTVALNVQANTRINGQRITDAVRAIDRQTTVHEAQLEVARRNNDQGAIAASLAEIRNHRSLTDTLRNLQTTIRDIPGHTSHNNNASVPAGQMDTR